MLEDLIVEQSHLEGDSGFDAMDHGFAEGSLHAHDRFFASWGPHQHFGQQGVVIPWYRVAVVEV